MWIDVDKLFNVDSRCIVECFAQGRSGHMFDQTKSHKIQNYAMQQNGGKDRTRCTVMCAKHATFCYSE